MKQNPDNRVNNVTQMQQSIDGTSLSIQKAENLIRAASNSKTKAELSAKNERQDAALNALSQEIKDEADFQKNPKA